MLQEQIIDMSLHDDVDVIWCGDLNSRCGNLSDFIEDEGKYMSEGNTLYDIDHF